MKFIIHKFIIPQIHTYRNILQIKHNPRIINTLQNKKLEQDLVLVNNDKVLLVPYESTNTYMILMHIVDYIPMFVDHCHKADSDSKTKCNEKNIFL